MAALGFIWRVLRRRPLIRLLVWLVLRVIRWFGWRRSAKLAFRQRRHGFAVVLGLWRATVRLLRLSRATWRLLGWIARHVPRVLGFGSRDALASSAEARRRRLRAPGPARVPQKRESAGPKLSARVARRRDELRRSLFASVGVDPNWRPKRKPQSERPSASPRKGRARLGDGVAGRPRGGS